MSHKDRFILFVATIGSLLGYGLILAVIGGYAYLGYDALPAHFDRHDHVLAIVIAVVIGISAAIVTALAMELPCRIKHRNNKHW